MQLPTELNLMRIVSQGLVPGTASSDPNQVVRRMLATQGQLPSAMPHSLIVRTTAATRSDVELLFEQGRLVRFWPFRGTSHIVAAEDQDWLRALGRTEPNTWFQRKSRELGLTDRHLQQARDLALQRIAQGPARWGDIRDAWVRGGITKDLKSGDPRWPLRMLFTELHGDGTLISGPLVAGEHRVVATSHLPTDPTGLAERLRDGDPDAVRKARAEVARRYAISRGPVTAQDLARWAGFGMGAARAALEDAVTLSVEVAGRGASAGVDSRSAVRERPCGEQGASVGGVPPGVSASVMPDAGVPLVRMHLEDRALVACTAADRSHRDFYMRADLPELLEANRKEAARTLYLASFDELHVGYKDRSCLTDAEGEKLICPGGNGMFRPLVVDRGRVVAVNPKTLGLIWHAKPSKRLERDTGRAMRRVARRLAR